MNTSLTGTQSHKMKSMMSGMIRTGHYDQIFQTIVSLNPVDVMNMLRAIQFSPKVRFHHRPMFKAVMPFSVSTLGAASWTSCQKSWITVLPKTLVVCATQMLCFRSFLTTSELAKTLRSSLRAYAADGRASMFSPSIIVLFAVAVAVMFPFAIFNLTYFHLAIITH